MPGRRKVKRSKKQDKKAAAQNYVRLERSELRVTPGARLVGPADPSEVLKICVCVRQRPGGSPLPDHDFWTATPPSKRKFLSPAEFAAEHGAAQEDLEAVARFADAHGLAVVETNIAGRTVVLRGTVKQISRVFNLQLRRYQSPRGIYRSHEGFVHVPGELAHIVVAVFGLDSRRADARQNAGGDPAGTMPLSPLTVAELYSFPSPPPDATGQVIGVLEFSGVDSLGEAHYGGWNQSDIDTTMELFGLQSSFTPVDQPITGSNNPGSPSSPHEFDSEVMLDICVAAAAGPGATIRIYWGSDPTSSMDWVTLLTGVLKDPPTILSNSWALAPGDDLPTLTLSGITAGQVDKISNLFQSLAGMGVTVFSACGDDGSRSFTTDGRAHVQYPGSDPWVTSCGGTTIGPSPANVEWVWNDISPNDNLTPQATGGGISAHFDTVPSWQQGVQVPASINDGVTVGRGVPDVAGNASLRSGYKVSVDGTIGTYGGTSAVAPLYAGMMALITKRVGHPVGFLNPTLYAAPGTVCRDVNDQLHAGSPPDNGVPAFTNTKGKFFPAVKGYPSGPGWDACTGWGIIDGQALLAAIVDPEIDSLLECIGLLRNIKAATSQGVQATKAQWLKVERQLSTCYQQGYIDEGQYNAAINEIKSAIKSPKPPKGRIKI
jgi:kumamolisin